MDLVCPSCATRFVVEAAQLTPRGRTVRCGACGHKWHQRPEEEPAGPEQGPESAPESPTGTPLPEALAGPADEPLRQRPSVRPTAARRSAPRRGSLAAGWLLLLIVVAGLGALFYLGQSQIVARLPQSERLYVALGLREAPPGTGLELRDVTSERRVVRGEQVVVIAGRVANASEEVKAVPPLEARLVDSQGKELNRWVFSAARTSLPPGASTDFETTARNPPREGRLAIDFVMLQ